jgi:hypothetical protein
MVNSGFFSILAGDLVVLVLVEHRFYILVVIGRRPISLLFYKSSLTLRSHRVLSVPLTMRNITRIIIRCRWLLMIIKFNLFVFMVHRGLSKVRGKRL